MKRYSIVRVDGECPKGFNEDIYCKWCGNCGRIYGDTKEQLIKKVAQPLFKKFMTTQKFKGVKKKIVATRLAYKIAKEIVEFLGVEDDKEKRRR